MQSCRGVPEAGEQGMMVFLEVLDALRPEQALPVLIAQPVAKFLSSYRPCAVHGLVECPLTHGVCSFVVSSGYERLHHGMMLLQGQRGLRLSVPRRGG